MSPRTPTHPRAVAILVVAVAIAILRPVATPAQARNYTMLRFEIRPYAGAYIPTGDQRDFLKDAVLAGAQLSWLPIERLALTGTFGWSPTKDRITAGYQSLDVYQYDLGAEWRSRAWYRSVNWSLLPFVGAGVGGRTYDYRDLPVSSGTDFDGYGALGAELGFGGWGIRIEGRDYVSQFRNLSGQIDGTSTRNDVTIAAGLSVKF